MNPMMGGMGMNPMMMMMASMCGAAANTGGCGGEAEKPAEAQKPATSKGSGKARAPNAEHSRRQEIDPQITALCKAFNIEHRIERRLNDVMLTREESFDSDMKALWEVCETAKKPSGFLMVKIQELERGVFTGAGKLDREIASFSSKHKLDDRALSKLIEVVAPRKESMRDDLRDLERHIRGVQNPSNAIMPLLTQLKAGARLPSPPRDRDRDR